MVQKNKIKIKKSDFKLGTFSVRGGGGHMSGWGDGVSRESLRALLNFQD